MMTEASTQPAIHSEVDLFAGTPYRTIKRIASGGMGEVYVVAHRQLGRMLAAKVLHARLATDPRLVDRARVEAQAMARLRHGNIVAVVGFGSTSDQRPFIVMEYLRGCTLDQALKAKGAIAVLESLQLASQLLSALAAAHELGIVHRDVKPSNLFLCDAQDNVRLLKVLDFGVARILPDAPDAAPAPPVTPTASGVLVGTPRYVSPEGALGLRVDPRADLYSAALMLYCMLTGRGPFDDIGGDTAIVAAHAHREPESPSKVSRQNLPPELDTIVLKALRKNPDDRYQSALDFQIDIERVITLLTCPPALQPTAVLGAMHLQGMGLASLAVNSTTTPSSVSSNDSSAVAVLAVAGSRGTSAHWRGYLLVFVVTGVIAALLILLLERLP